MRIGIVEDDLGLGKALQLALQEAAHDTVWVRRLAEARCLLEDPAIDAALLDLVLPDGHGFGLLRAVRRMRPALPLIVMNRPGSHGDSGS